VLLLVLLQLLWSFPLQLPLRSAFVASAAWPLPSWPWDPLASGHWWRYLLKLLLWILRLSRVHFQEQEHHPPGQPENTGIQEACASSHSGIIAPIKYCLF